MNVDAGDRRIDHDRLGITDRCKTGPNALVEALHILCRYIGAEPAQGVAERLSCHCTSRRISGSSESGNEPVSDERVVAPTQEVAHILYAHTVGQRSRTECDGCGKPECEGS